MATPSSTPTAASSRSSSIPFISRTLIGLRAMPVGDHAPASQPGARRLRVSQPLPTKTKLAMLARVDAILGSCERRSFLQRVLYGWRSERDCTKRALLRELNMTRYRVGLAWRRRALLLASLRAWSAGWRGSVGALRGRAAPAVAVMAGAFGARTLLRHVLGAWFLLRARLQSGCPWTPCVSIEPPPGLARSSYRFQ